MSAYISPLPLHGRTENALHRTSLISAVLAMVCGLLALVGWLAHQPILRAGLSSWPPLRPAMAFGLVLCSAGALFQWSRNPKLCRAGSILGGVVAAWGLICFLPAYLTINGGWERAAWGWIVGPAEAALLPERAGVTNSAILVLAGLALIQLEPPRRAWLGPSAVFGSILLVLSLFGLITRLLVPATAAPGISGFGSVTALFLGVALASAHFNSGFIELLKSDNATGLIGRRLVIAATVLPPTLYVLQLGGGSIAIRAGFEQLAITTVALTFTLIGVLVFSLRRLQRIDADKKRTEEERDRLLYRVQQQAAVLQQEISIRTSELKLLYERHRLALRGSSYGVWDWNMTSGEQIWDAAMLEIHGLTDATFGGRHTDWLQIIHPDDRVRVQQLDWDALAPDDNLVFEYRIVRPDGSIRHLRAQGQPQFAGQDRLVRVVGLVRDETPEKAREAELGTLSERLQFVVSSAGYGVWEYDFKIDRLIWDDYLLKLHGVQRTEVRGGIETWRLRVHPEDWAEVQHHLNEVIAGRRDQFEPEYRIILPDGAVRFMQMRSYLIRQADGSPVRLVGLNRDVTTARELREQLRISEERWRLVVGSNNDAVWDWDIPHNRVYRDQRYSEMLGLGAGDLPVSGLEWGAQVYPEDRPHADVALQQHLDGNAAYYQCEYRMQHKNGHWIWTLDRGKVVARDSHGAPLRMVGTQTDITPRKTLEEKLRHNEMLSLQLNRLAQIGAWEEEIETGRILWAPEMYRIHEVELGYVPNLKDGHLYYPPEAYSVLAEAFQHARQDGTPFDLELPFKTARGQALWVRILGQAEMRDGKIARLFGGFQDITARRGAEEMRRQLEGQLFQAQKMETLGTLAGGIAHDFNNLLTGILGYQDLAFDGLSPDHESRPFLEASREASLRARELVDQILTFSRQTGSKKSPVDLKTIVEDARRFLRSTVPATIRMEVTTAPDCGLVIADATQIHQVLLNLGTNAAHAMYSAGGVMRISLYPMEIAESASFNQLAPGKYVRLDFSDTGHGMDENTCKRIFDPFFTTKEVGQGTGLGLSMVHGIMQAHSGTITVESSEGKGTTFSLFLPVAETNEPAIDTAERATPRGRGELVAIVDDEDLVRSFAQISLERAGYRVVSFDRATTCLEDIQTHIADFSVLLTDQTMPGMNGMELVTEIRKIAPLLPVIIMSGYYSRIAPEKLQQMGHVSLISKPFTNEELAQAVHSSARPGSVPPF